MRHLRTIRRVATFAVAATTIFLACGCSDNGPGGPHVAAHAVLSAAPTSGTTITGFEFDAGASTTSGPALEFRWDWESDGTWDTDWSSTAIIARIGAWDADNGLPRPCTDPQ